MQEYLIISLIIAPFITYYTTIIIEKIQVKQNFTAEDMHKKKGRYLPKSGGLGFLIGWTISLTPLLIVSGLKAYTTTSIVIVWIAGLIGLYDDYRKLGGKTKVALTLIPGIALVITRLYNPYLYIPFVGTIRLTILYPLLVPIAFAIASNAINMIDTFTGIAPGTTLILTSFSALLLYHTTESPDYPLYLAIITTASLIGYIPRNMYPGKTFNGDTGTLAWGAILALIAITGKIEFFIILAAMPVVTNGFTILASIKGFLEHDQIKQRPTIPNREENTIRANPHPKAPITLTHLLTLKLELKENEVVCATLLMVLFTTILSIILFLLIL